MSGPQYDKVDMAALDALPPKKWGPGILTEKKVPEPAPMKVDPWEHRAAGMRCRTCMWYVPKAGARELGRCRRHAPTLNGYPVVMVDDWCGDHKLNEAV